MNMVYVLYEERESSQLCGVRGVCDTWDNAVAHMRLLIENNHLYSNLVKLISKRGILKAIQLILRIIIPIIILNKWRKCKKQFIIEKIMNCL